jgi:glutaredoxin
MRYPVIYLLIVAALAVSTAQAEKLYRWVGKDGKVSYQDRPPPADAATVQEKDLSSRRSSSVSGSEEGADAARNFPVVLYTVPKCGTCDEARAYLKKRHVPFSEKSVGNNPALQKEMIEKVGQLSVPTVTVGSKVMNGYVQSLLAGELDQAGYPKEGKEEGEQASQENAPSEENATP